ncbi:trypsin-like peptidase domain-containing protein [Streptomyces sp. MST-110588]|uniref:S1C family serine protease n=1 Tax=Streptomyces sp. MST-110588 TaxID=2833628 RepID=UPI001F5DE3CF|nr:trypsin-like peptidase domain-containing protein [Streptomyces sp. MST-110588]UNO42506.1 trypsin-like peptidase domain-containing protein [Streptomyces sp. MST-110588]
MTPSLTLRHGVVAAAVTTVCVTALVAGCSDSGSGSGAAAGSSGTAPATTSSGAVAPSVSTDLQNAYQKVVKDVLPSVVQITTGQELGSGVVYDGRGHIVTNAHVVGDSERFKVTLATGGRTLEARLVSSYPRQDLAVIKVDKPPQDLKPAVFGDSSKVAVGQIVLAMGNPLGLSSSVTQGIVSATGRTVSEGGDGGRGPTIANMVQTSAAINPGNSGGALVNLSDQVIGIPTLAATDPQMGSGAAPGIGFAIPASTVRNIADQIIGKGRVTDSHRAALGITGRTVLGPDLEPAGVAVASVTRGGPADKAGIRPGDVIVKFGGAQVATIEDLTAALAAHEPGDTVEVTVARDGAERTVRVPLGKL